MQFFVVHHDYKIEVCALFKLGVKNMMIHCKRLFTFEKHEVEWSKKS